MTTSLLPPSATTRERDLEAAMAHMEAVDVAVIATTGRADACPDAVVPWLAWARSVDWWDTIWSDEQRRAVIAAAWKIHKHKGTPASIKWALSALGFTGATVLEGLHNRKHDGQVTTRTGKFFRGEKTYWAGYRVLLDKPIANRMVPMVKGILAATAPARSRLFSLDYTEVPNVHDGRSLHDGTYNYGVSI